MLPMKQAWRSGALAVAVTAVAAQATTPSPLTPAKMIGAREQILRASLSRSGRRIAFVTAAADRGAIVQVVDLNAGAVPKTVLSSDGRPYRLQSCTWATDQRLVCGIYLITTVDGDRLDFTRIVALDADGGDAKVLSARSSDRALGIAQGGGNIIDWSGSADSGSVLMTREFIPESETGTRLANSSVGLGVERVDTKTMRRTRVEAARFGASEYITDGLGRTRVMGLRPRVSNGYVAPRTIYQYRRADSQSWEALSSVDDNAGKASGFEPYAVDPALNIAYGFEPIGGRAALVSVALDGSLKKSTVLARDDVDVDGLIRIGRQRRVVGATFVTDKRQSVFFDPELKRLGAALQKAIPGLPLVNFIDASADEKKLLLWAGSDTDPGRYMLFDKTTRKLEELLPVRPQLSGVKLAEVRPVRFPAADGTTIPGYLTLPPGSDGKNIAAIVMPHGGPGARDEWGFDWLAQFYANQGFAVLQPNFRGSTGYGDAWFKENGFKSWRTAVGDVNDAGRWLIAQGIARPERLAIVGWSYGGYAALQSSVLDPKLFKAIVAVAPVTDLSALREDARQFVNFRAVDAFIGEGPHVREGSPAQNAGKITAPVLLFHGNQDRNVAITQSRMMVDRLKSAGGKVELVEFRDLDHYLDDSIVRATLLERSSAFLKGSLGM